MLRDFAALAALYFIYPTVQAKYGLPGLFVWWNLAGRKKGGKERGREDWKKPSSCFFGGFFTSSVFDGCELLSVSSSSMSGVGSDRPVCGSHLPSLPPSLSALPW